MLATVTSKGQVTIPKEIRDLLHIRSNDKVDFVLDGERVLLTPVKTLLNLRGSVRADGKGDFPQERIQAKAAVAKRVSEEMK
jgi:AbrB family looped-hinge helix DNA binding protein